ncbi:hypothetical protein OW763_15480 [Clostridium aestuarii]|uniref:Uncharacterized protein n=1 Tax=Clostridium aestuarii TaxID=338193 RepID=A0ABT4D3B7_9CLOT|nr:hypothetical protein [Clostridium aestuarii]MCY6485726.1 hypothetical protein [Clostridium aestuarii]
MNRIIYINSNLKKVYKDGSVFGKIKDKFNTRYIGESFIKDLGVSITTIKFPPNFNKRAYQRNIYNIKKRFGNNNVRLAIKTFRSMDYYFYNDFQKRMLAYSVIKSLQLILMRRKKSIGKNCVLIYDASDDINKYIIYELAKKAKYFILLSNNIRKIRVLCDYVLCSYGVSPIITNDMNYAIDNSDFIITSRQLDISNNCPIWYLDNMFVPKDTKDIIINDVTYFTPWKIEKMDITSELIGAMYNPRSYNDIEKFLYKNDIFLDKIKFGKHIIT